MEDAPQSDAGHAPLAEASVAGTFSELDQWVAAEGIFLHQFQTITVLTKKLKAGVQLLS